MIFPGRNGEILRTCDFVLPKFHLVLPKFYFGPPWGFLFCSVGDLDFLRSFWRESLVPLVILVTLVILGASPSVLSLTPNL